MASNRCQNSKNNEGQQQELRKLRHTIEQRAALTHTLKQKAEFNRCSNSGLPKPVPNCGQGRARTPLGATPAAPGEERRSALQRGEQSRRLRRRQRQQRGEPGAAAGAQQFAPAAVRWQRDRPRAEPQVPTLQQPRPQVQSQEHPQQQRQQRQRQRSRKTEQAHCPQQQQQQQPGQ